VDQAEAGPFARRSRFHSSSSRFAVSSCASHGSIFRGDFDEAPAAAGSGARFEYDLARPPSRHHRHRAGMVNVIAHRLLPSGSLTRSL
jgi:hypothetical protein